MNSPTPNGTERDEVDFRGIRWGASPDAVRASEGQEPLAMMPGSMVFRDSLFGMTMLVTYSFAEVDGTPVCFGAAITNDPAQNNFYSKLQSFSKPVSRVNEAIADYGKVRDALKRELGDPVVEDSPYENQELMSALRDHGSGEAVELEQLRELSGDPDSSLIPTAEELAHTDEELKALMIYSFWQSETTDTKAYLEPTAFGGAMLIARFMSRELAKRVLPDPGPSAS